MAILCTLGCNFNLNLSFRPWPLSLRSYAAAIYIK